MKLYTAKLAPNPLRVEIFLKEKGIFDQIESIEIELSTEAKSPEHRARNKLGLVPVLELDDGTCLSESRAICSYIEALHPSPNLMGESALERAQIEMHDRQMELAFLMSLAGWVRHTHPGLAMLEKPQMPEWGAICEKRTRRMAAFIDKELAQKPYIAGDRFTIADITLFSGINFGRIVKFKPWEEHENIAKWRDSLLQRPSFQ